MDDLWWPDNAFLNSINNDDTISVVKGADLVAVLVHTEQDVCLAVVEIMSFEATGSKTHLISVSVEDLEDDAKKYIVHGQWYHQQQHLELQIGYGQANMFSLDLRTRMEH